MATVTPTGPVGAVLTALRDSMGSSAAWQTWTDSDDAAEAKGHVYYGEVSETGITRPFAVIGVAAISRPSRGTLGRTSHGTIFVSFIDGDPSSNLEDAYLNFTNRVGAVMEQVANASLTGLGGLIINAYEIGMATLTRPAEGEGPAEGEVYVVSVEVDFGDGG